MKHRCKRLNGTYQTVEIDCDENEHELIKERKAILKIMGQETENLDLSEEGLKNPETFATVFENSVLVLSNIVKTIEERKRREENDRN